MQVMQQQALPSAPAVEAGIEHICDGDVALAYVIRGAYEPTHTEFVTPDDLSQQVGLICCPSGRVIKRHVHNPVTRTIVGTSEAIFVRRGVVRLHLYNDEKRFITSRLLKTGDLVFLVGGGHGFEILQDAVLLEVKQGPYVGEHDKTRF